MSGLCSGLSYPLDMEQNPAIDEAWLNHEGTVYAIVWKSKDQTRKVAKPIFKEHGVAYFRLSKDEVAQLMTDFRSEGKWYRGESVDELSLIESGHIAESATASLLDLEIITPEEAALIKADVEDYFKRELVKLRTLEELTVATQTTFQEAVIAIFEKHLGEDRTEPIIRAFGREADKISDECCKASDGKKPRKSN